MRAINTFMLLSLALAFIMATIDRVVRHVLARGREVEREEVVPPLMLVAETVPSPVEVPKYCAAAGAKWLAEARALAVRIYRERGEVTADDIWNEFRPPEGVDGRLLGPVFATKEWEKVGERRSERGNNNNRYIAVWKLKQAEDIAA